MPPVADEGEPDGDTEAAQEDMEEAGAADRAGPHSGDAGSGSAVDAAGGAPHVSAAPSGRLQPEDSGPLGSDAELEVFAAGTPLLDSFTAARPSHARQTAGARARITADAAPAVSSSSGAGTAETGAWAEPSGGRRARQLGSTRCRLVLDSDDEEDEGAGALTGAPPQARAVEVPTALGTGAAQMQAAGSPVDPSGPRRRSAEEPGALRGAGDRRRHQPESGGGVTLPAAEAAGTLGDDDDDDIVWEPCRTCSGSGKLRRSAADTQRSLQQEDYQQQRRGAQEGPCEQVASGAGAVPCDIPAAALGTPDDRGQEPLAELGHRTSAAAPGAAVDLTMDPDLGGAAATAQLPAPQSGAGHAPQLPVASTSLEQTVASHGSPPGLPLPAASSTLVTGQGAGCAVGTLPRSSMGSSAQRSTPGTVQRQRGILDFYSRKI